LSADIGNAYLQAPAREQVHTTAGPEFRPSKQGQTVIILRAMYGLKSSCAAWYTQLSEKKTHSIILSVCSTLDGAQRPITLRHPIGIG
jgi:hypothetical protein